MRNMPKGYDSSETSVHFMGYHFVWCPKYRRKVLDGDIAKRARELIRKKAEDLDCKVISLEVQPDHIHLFIQGSPIMTPNEIVGAIKGYTSHELRKEFKRTTYKASHVVDEKLFRLDAWAHLGQDDREIHRRAEGDAMKSIQIQAVSDKNTGEESRYAQVYLKDLMELPS